MPPFTNDTIISYFFLHSRTVESVDFSSTDRRVKKILIVDYREIISGFPVYGCLYSGILIKTYSCSSDGYQFLQRLKQSLRLYRLGEMGI